MMTKTEFLTHLEKRLQVLKQQEREDILGEYAQHIELKIGSGLSEEEAIHDFGDIEELADEILDAYNVNPDFGKGEQHHPMELLGELGRMAAACKRGFLKVIRWRPGKAGRSLEDGAAPLEGEAVLSGDRDALPDGVKKKRNTVRDMLKRWETKDVAERRDTGMWKRICDAGRKLGRLAVICWRLCVIAFLVPFAFCDALAFAGLGLLLVLVLQGYPLFGVLIITVGLLISGVAFVWFIWSLVFGRKEKKTWEPEEN